MKSLLIAAAATVALSACGGDTYVKVQGTTTVSKGQELADLQRAFAEDALTESEYERLRQKVLARPN